MPIVLQFSKLEHDYKPIVLHFFKLEHDSIPIVLHFFKLKLDYKPIKINLRLKLVFQVFLSSWHCKVFWQVI